MKREGMVSHRGRPARGLMAGLIGVWLVQPVWAQSDGGDFGGSFEDPAPVAQPTTPPLLPPIPAGGDVATPAPGGDFGGSFDDGAFPAPKPAAPDPVVPVQGTDPPPPPPPPTPPPPPLPPPPPPLPAEGGVAQPVIGGGDFGDTGSFDPVAGGGGVTPQPAPPVVQPNPAPQPPPAQPSGPVIDPQIAVFEMRDFGVPPISSLRSGQFHAPTPTAVPGAQTVTTESLAAAMTAGMQMVVIDVLGGNYSLPNAYVAPELASPGGFNDRTQQRASQWLTQITGGTKDLPVVIYCSGPECGLSYNAALRTVAAGYTNVYWYRGGLDAWQMAGLQLYPAAF